MIQQDKCAEVLDISQSEENASLSFIKSIHELNIDKQDDIDSPVPVAVTQNINMYVISVEQISKVCLYVILDIPTTSFLYENTL